ncbi:acyltransferase [Macrococcus carouselicus]|uniref:Acyltransferase n=1 Tax=Macrococcus carouselicus TaxID=69969 RepID=A0A9Q8CH06_9STAP|nr:acyltransferase [Macrococcus carouselicus]TDM03689.1 acyltransferase [Macrococcus carouselicus]
MRRLKRHKVTGPNPLWHVYRILPFGRTAFNTIIIELGRYCPSMPMKKKLYELTGMTIGEKTSIAYKVTPDIMYPEKITIGSNCVIGFNSTILCHEYLIDEYRTGEVIIGDEVMIGANALVLPGVIIGDRAVIGANTVVTKDVPASTFAYGNPMQIRE